MERSALLEKKDKGPFPAQPKGALPREGPFCIQKRSHCFMLYTSLPVASSTTVRVKDASARSALRAVSYTHLDVYKRQGVCGPAHPV